MPTVHIPTSLRRWTQNQAMVQGPCGTLDHLMAALETAAPGLRSRVYDERGQIRSYIRVFVNETDIRHLDGDSTLLGERDDVFIIPAIAGGCASQAGQHR